MKPHREPRRHILNVADLEQEIALPGKAVVFAVGDEPQPDVLLQAHHGANRIVLDARQLGRWDLALLRGRSRRDQRIGPDQAADMVGAERRFIALEQGSLVQFLWSFPRKRESITTAPDDSARPVTMAPRFRADDSSTRHAIGVKGWQCLHEVCQWRLKLRLRRLWAMSGCAPRIWATGRAMARACSACSALTNRARRSPSAWTTASSASSSVPTAAKASAFSAGKSPMRRHSTPSRHIWRNTRSRSRAAPARWPTSATSK